MLFGLFSHHSGASPEGVCVAGGGAIIGSVGKIVLLSANRRGKEKGEGENENREQKLNGKGREWNNHNNRAINLDLVEHVEKFSVIKNTSDLMI